MSVLVTGGGGFVGGAVAEALLAGGHAVVLADLAAPPAAAGIRAVALDVRDEADAEALLRRHAVSRVLHAAAVTAEPKDAQAQARLVEINVDGTRAICRAARRAGVGRVLVVGSAAVYEGATGDDPLGEDAPTRPTTRYGASKLAAEEAALAEAGDALDVRIVRLGALFGPFEAPTASRAAMSPLYDLVHWAKAGRHARVRDTRPLDWLYSRDAAAALKQLLLAPRLRHTTYNLGGGRPWSLLLACEALVRLCPGFGFSLAGPAEPADVPSGAGRPPLDCARLSADIGFAARDAEAAISDYLRWLDECSPVDPRRAVPA